MRGREFLNVARDLLLLKTPAHWRSSVSRAYYALLLEGRESLRRWGFALPRGDRIHAFVRLRFTYSADQPLRWVGMKMDNMVQLRGKADYELVTTLFDTDATAQS